MKKMDEAQQYQKQFHIGSQTGSTGKRRLPFALILLVLSGVCILLGCFRGEAAYVFRQAVNICFECIGLG